MMHLAPISKNMDTVVNIVNSSLFCFKVGHFNMCSYGDLLVWWPLEELQLLVLPHWL